MEHIEFNKVALNSDITKRIIKTTKDICILYMTSIVINIIMQIISK